MSRASERAIARQGVVGTVDYRYSEGSNGIIDLTEWAVAEFGPWTGSGYTEIISTHRTKTEAEKRAREERGTRTRAYNTGRILVLHKQHDGTWAKP